MLALTLTLTVSEVISIAQWYCGIQECVKSQMCRIVVDVWLLCQLICFKRLNKKEISCSSNTFWLVLLVWLAVSIIIIHWLSRSPLTQCSRCLWLKSLIEVDTAVLRLVVTHCSDWLSVDTAVMWLVVRRGSDWLSEYTAVLWLVVSRW